MPYAVFNLTYDWPDKGLPPGLLHQSVDSGQAADMFWRLKGAASQNRFSRVMAGKKRLFPGQMLVQLAHVHYLV
ncbi:hypothetical protein [Taklimakanibacter lacteus]|uniref:hypothetical protein n=1 Tax=Taklimakanibacter lacteus TaxID=2268456 RepID=UPI000E671E9B